jgi:hypothetical protein
LIGQQSVEHARNVSRPLVKIRNRTALDEAVVLPVVAGMAQRGDEIAVSRKRLCKAFMRDLGSALAVANNDEALDRGIRCCLWRHVGEKRAQGDRTLCGVTGLVQGHGNRFLRVRQTRQCDLTPAGLRGQGGHGGRH